MDFLQGYLTVPIPKSVGAAKLVLLAVLGFQSMEVLRDESK